MANLIYLGVFLDAMINGTLAHQIQFEHVTHLFRPDPAMVNQSFFGKKVDVQVIGYGNNGLNEGLLVSLRAADPDLQAALDQIKVPHITLSVSETGKPADTAKLKFTRIDGKTFSGTYGGFFSDNKVHTSIESDGGAR